LRKTVTTAQEDPVGKYLHCYQAPRLREVGVSYLRLKYHLLSEHEKMKETFAQQFVKIRLI
jgi:hypothetical protein